MQLNNIKFYLKRIYRLSLSFKKHDDIVWKELKKLHADAKWKSGIYENDKYIETVFEIGNNQRGIFTYMIDAGYYHCKVKILEDYNDELTTDFFILASHFNNLLNTGVVKINVLAQFIEYHQKRELLMPLLFSGEIYNQLIDHHKTSKLIYAAFQRLVNEHEAPAIIIADFLKDIDTTDGESS
jgi:hypothetical protein